MSYNPKSLFDKIQEKEKENATATNTFINPLLFKPKINTTYTLRLLWLAPEKGYNREYPMINSYVHKFWDDNASNGQKEHKVICPTSQYIMGETSAAFKRCPICEATSKFYNEGKAGSVSSNELYKIFRRTCMGYIPVYIVNGPEEDLHQIRILQYGKQFKDFFDLKIFGVVKQSKNKNADEIPLNLSDEAIGLEAFMYYDTTNDSIVTEGYDLIITTTTKRMEIGNKSVDMPQYQLDFTRKKRSITEMLNIDLTTPSGIKFFESLNSSILHFDKDFYLTSTDEELQKFKLNYVTKEEIQEKTEVESNSNLNELEKIEEAEETEETEKINDNKLNKDKAEDDINIPRNNDGEIDIDALIKGI